MPRVIDNDAKAIPLVMEICQTTMGQSIWLLRKLREETPKWWDGIDPEDHTPSASLCSEIMQPGALFKALNLEDVS